ncbi:MAG: HEAT repeat domain-containing protein [Planctomycetaceae bacterium]|nr:HEAT repeat domain-containing protein [Planctomycetaceae bacterium]
MPQQASQAQPAAGDRRPGTADISEEGSGEQVREHGRTSAAETGAAETSAGLESDTTLPGSAKVLKIQCRCGRRFRVKKNRAGQKVRCPACEKPVVVPVVDEPQADSTAQDGHLPSFTELAAAVRREEEIAQAGGTVVNKKLSDRRLKKLAKQLETSTAELTHEQELAHRDAVTELGKSGDSRACELLVRELRAPSPILRKAAITALGELGCPQAVAPLVELMGDTEPDVLRAVIRSLQQIGGTRVVRPLVVLGLAAPHVKYLVTDAVARLDEAAVSVLLDLLSHRDPGLVLEAVVLLGRLRVKKAVRSLVEVIEIKSPLFRSHAAEALGQIGDPKAVPTLQRLVDDSSPIVRLNAVIALGRIPDANSVRPLAARLTDEDEDVRLAAVTALESIGDERAADPLAGLLADRSDRVRLAATVALGELGDARATAPLLKYAEQEDLEVRLQAMGALKKLKDPAATRCLLGLLGHREHRIRERAVDILGHCGDSEVAERLEQVLRQDRAEDVRAAAAKALGEIADPVSVDVLSNALTDQFSVRCRAIVSLGQIGDDSAQPALLAMLKDQTPEVRFHACNAIGEAGLKSARPALEPLLYDSSPMAQRAAARALVRLGDPRGESLLEDRQLKKWQGRAVPDRGMGSVSWKDRLAGFVPDSLLGTGLQDQLQKPAVLGGGLVGLLVVVGAVLLWVNSGPAGPPVITGKVASVSFSPQGDKLAVGRTFGLLQIWDVASGELKSTDESFIGEGVAGLSFGAGDDVLLLAQGTKVAFEGTTDSVPAGHTTRIVQTIRTPDRKLTATMSVDGVIMIWDMQSRAVRNAIQIPAGNSKALAITADGQQIAGADAAGTVTIWNSSSGETERTYSAPVEVKSLEFAAEGKQLLLGLKDWTLQVWSLAEEDEEATPRTIACPERVVPTFLRSMSGNDELIMASGSNVYLTDLSAEKPEFSMLFSLDNPLNTLDVSPDGSLIAASGEGGSDVILYDVRTKKQRAVLFTPAGR